MTPTAPGVYKLRLPSGNVVRRRVREINGELFMVLSGGLWGLFASLVPMDLVVGIWID
jgi:hypothetical protein